MQVMHALICLRQIIALFCHFGLKKFGRFPKTKKINLVKVTVTISITHCNE